MDIKWVYITFIFFINTYAFVDEEIKQVILHATTDQIGKIERKEDGVVMYKFTAPGISIQAKQITSGKKHTYEIIMIVDNDEKDLEDAYWWIVLNARYKKLHPERLGLQT